MTRPTPPPPGLLELATDLARQAEWVRTEVTKADPWMAHGYTAQPLDKSRLVILGVHAWVDSIPPRHDTNPHALVHLVGATTAEALHALDDAELHAYSTQLDWSLQTEKRPEIHAWLTRAREQARSEAARRHSHPNGAPGGDD